MTYDTQVELALFNSIPCDTLDNQLTSQACDVPSTADLPSLNVLGPMSAPVQLPNRPVSNTGAQHVS